MAGVNLLELRSLRQLTSPADQLHAAGTTHHVGHPVTGAEWRCTPLEHCDRRPRRLCGLELAVHGEHPAAESGHEFLALVRNVEGPVNRQAVLQDSIDRTSA